MNTKGFLVKVELNIQKITCPGVWLCSNGKVSLQIHMLDSSIQTKSCKPVFPMLCNDTFVFSKIFHNDRRLNELQRSLNSEWFYTELIQWKTCDEGCVLATFQTTLDDLLYPSTFRGSIAGMDIDLLMEPTKLFPGTIAPKLEVSTKTTIEEIIFDLPSQNSNMLFVNPKALLSTHPSRKGRPRKVCHTVAFSRGQGNFPVKETKKKPIFKYRRPSDDLILRSNPNVVLKNDFIRKNPLEKSPSSITCYCRSSIVDDVYPKTLSNITLAGDLQNKPEVRNQLKHRDNCSICSTYEGYFSTNNSKMRTYNSNSENNRSPIKLKSFCKNHLKKHHLRSGDGSACGSDLSEDSKRKVCFCVPEERASSLAQELHKKLSKTLDANSRLFHKCIGCEEVII